MRFAREVSAALVGLVPDEPHQDYGEQIFVKLLAQCVTLRQLSPDPGRTNPQELWDLSSVSAVARCVVEAYDAMAYISLAQITADERRFRILLWEFHDSSRRVKMLTAIGSDTPQFHELVASTKKLKQKLLSDPIAASLDLQFSKRVEGDDPPSFHLSHKERCAANSVDFDFYNIVTMQLSQYVHTLPISVHQLMQFKAGTPEALHLMALPLQYTLAFLCRAIEGMGMLFPGRAPVPNGTVKMPLLVWSGMAARGMKSAA